MNNKINNNATRAMMVAPTSTASLISATFIYIVIIFIFGLLGYYIYKWSKDLEKRIQESKASEKKKLECPDYWTTTGKNICQNTYQLGICALGTDGSPDTMDFNDAVFTDKNIGEYSKCKWAKQCNVVWGGVDDKC